jgi:hypothetical protein
LQQFYKRTKHQTRYQRIAMSSHACVSVNQSCNDFTKEQRIKPDIATHRHVISCVCFVDPSCNYVTKEQNMEQNSRMPLIPFFRQSPFRTFRQIIQPGFDVDAFDEMFEMEIV